MFVIPPNLLASMPEEERATAIKLADQLNEAAQGLDRIFARNEAVLRATLPPAKPHRWTLYEAFVFVTMPLVNMAAALVLVFWYPPQFDVLFSLLKGYVAGSAMILAIGQLARTVNLVRDLR